LNSKETRHAHHAHECVLALIVLLTLQLLFIDQHVIIHQSVITHPLQISIHAAKVGLHCCIWKQLHVPGILNLCIAYSVVLVHLLLCQNNSFCNRLWCELWLRDRLRLQDRLRRRRPRLWPLLHLFLDCELFQNRQQHRICFWCFCLHFLLVVGLGRFRLSWRGGLPLGLLGLIVTLGLLALTAVNIFWSLKINKCVFSIK